MRNYQDLTSIFSASAALKQAFTVTTATDLVTSNAHGLSDGDTVVLTTTTTLPAGLSLTTQYYVISPTTNTFRLSSSFGGSAVDITDTGTGTHTYQLYGKIMNVSDFQNVIISIDTINSANFTVKFQGSIAEIAPDFLKTQATTNSWDYIEIIDLQNGSAIDGDTGIAPAGSDDHRIFEFNINGLKWVTANLTSWTAGNLQIGFKPFSNI